MYSGIFLFLMDHCENPSITNVLNKQTSSLMSENISSLAANSIARLAKFFGWRENHSILSMLRVHRKPERKHLRN